jgi:hypothetical protein
MDRNEITHAIQKFPNIESITVKKGTTLECIRWRSQGFTNTYEPTLLEPCGVKDWPDTLEELGARSLLAVIGAFASARTERSEARALKHISARGISWQAMTRLEPLIANLGHILSQVGDVSLRFRLEKQGRQRVDWGRAVVLPKKDLAALPSFIALFERIRHLDLRFETTFQKMTDFSSLMDGVQWRYLVEVTFGGILFDKSDMIGFITNHKETLKSLTLIDTCLSQGGQWCNLLEEIRELRVIRYFSIEGEMLVQSLKRRYPSINPLSTRWCAIADYVEGESDVNPFTL